MFLLLLGRSWSHLLIWVSLTPSPFSCLVTDSAGKNDTFTNQDMSQTHPNDRAVAPRHVVDHDHTHVVTDPEVPPSPEDADSQARLKWVKFEGSIPPFAVHVNNTHTGRTDYVCRPTDVTCKAGYYSPTKGDYCYFCPTMRRKMMSSTFEILVNEDNFERLAWETGNFGKLRPRSVKTCAEQDVFVGNHYYGLGAVVLSAKSIYLPWNNKPYSYWKYSLLTVIQPTRQVLGDIKYKTDKATTLPELAIVLASTVVENNTTSEVTKRLEMQAQVEDSKAWVLSHRLTHPVETSTRIEGMAPTLEDGVVKFTGSGEFILHGHEPLIQTEHVNFEVVVKAPPKQKCDLHMIGEKSKLTVPFTGTLTHYYKNMTGSEETTIEAEYENIKVTKFKPMADICIVVSSEKKPLRQNKSGLKVTPRET